LRSFQKRLFEVAKSQSDACLLVPTDGAVASFLLDAIQMGVDAANPI
jgi:hypothetical protein